MLKTKLLEKVAVLLFQKCFPPKASKFQTLHILSLPKCGTVTIILNMCYNNWISNLKKNKLNFQCDFSHLNSKVFWMRSFLIHSCWCSTHNELVVIKGMVPCLKGRVKLIPNGSTANNDIKVNSLGIFFPRFGSEVAYFVSNLKARSSCLLTLFNSPSCLGWVLFSHLSTICQCHREGPWVPICSEKPEGCWRSHFTNPAGRENASRNLGSQPVHYGQTVQ